MLGLELVVALCAAVLAGSVLARRFSLPTPAVLVASGLLLSAVPAFHGVGLPPEMVLLLFLPALLYWESLTTSLREIRRFLRGVLLTGTVLVVLTAAAVAAVAHALGLDWGTAWIIGAAVAPTDATAVSSVGGALPRRQTTVLRAESLINDGTALVVYATAVGVVTGVARIDAWSLTSVFAVSFGGGVAVGLAVGWVMFEVRRRIAEALFANVASVLTPFVAYLIAEMVHASGVLAVVTCGLYVSQVAPRTIAASVRQQGAAFWTLSTFLLNGGLFVLVGLHLPASVRELTSVTLGRAVLVTGAVYATTLAVRIVFLIVTAYTIRALDRRPQQRLLRASNRSRVVSTVAGLRGAVSLAVALSVPEVLPGGGAFPDRDLIVFVVAGIVVNSLVIQGLALPWVIGWARFPSDHSVRDELRLAQHTATEEALQALPELARDQGTSPEVVERLRREYAEHLTAARADQAGHDDHPALLRARQYTQLRLALIAHKRGTVIRLRDERRIDDTVLRQIQARLDTEELRLLPPEPSE